MSKKKDYTSIFNVITLENGDTAEVLMYGYIGQQDYWGENTEKDLTAIEFAKTISDLEKKFSRINIRINSPGGSMYHGNSIINSIRNSSADIHLYNDGLAASMAADIFLCVPTANRHMANNALLMLHPAISGTYGNSQDLREMADILDKFTETIIPMIAEASGMDVEKIRTDFYTDFKDHWMTYAEVVDYGFVSNDDDYESESAPSNEVQNASYVELLQKFSHKNNEKKSTSFAKNMIERITSAFNPATPAPTNTTNQNQEDMTLAEFKTAIQNGDLTAEQVNNALAEHTAANTTAATPAPAAPAVENTELTEAMKTIETLNARIEKLENKPAVAPTAAAAEKDPSLEDGEPTVEDQLKNDAEMHAEDASNYNNPFSEKNRY